MFGIGQADPLSCHRADVVVGVEVGLLNLASIDHIDDVIYGDAGRQKARERQAGQNTQSHFKGVSQVDLVKNLKLNHSTAK